MDGQSIHIWSSLVGSNTRILESGWSIQILRDSGGKIWLRCKTYQDQGSLHTIQHFSKKEVGRGEVKKEATIDTAMQFPCRTMLVSITSAQPRLAVITLQSKLFAPSKKKDIIVSPSFFVASRVSEIERGASLLQCNIMSSSLSTICGLFLLSLDISSNCLQR